MTNWVIITAIIVAAVGFLAFAIILGVSFFTGKFIFGYERPDPGAGWYRIMGTSTPMTDAQKQRAAEINASL